jgi:hypothetical protein
VQEREGGGGSGAESGTPVLTHFGVGRGAKIGERNPRKGEPVQQIRIINDILRESTLVF